MTYDRELLAVPGDRYQYHRAQMEDARLELTREIPDAIRAGVPQVEIAKLTGLTRERIRQIARAAGIEG